MSAPTYRALDVVLMGMDPAVEVGELVPATCTGTLGDTIPVDFERLLALGVVEAVRPPGGASGGAKAPKGAPPAGAAKPAQSSPK